VKHVDVERRIVEQLAIDVIPKGARTFAQLGFPWVITSKAFSSTGSLN